MISFLVQRLLSDCCFSDAGDEQLSHTSFCLIRPGDKQQHGFIFLQNAKTLLTPAFASLLRRKAYTVRRLDRTAGLLCTSCAKTSGSERVGGRGAAAYSITAFQSTAALGSDPELELV